MLAVPCWVDKEAEYLPDPCPSLAYFLSLMVCKSQEPRHGGEGLASVGASSCPWEWRWERLEEQFTNLKSVFLVFSGGVFEERVGKEGEGHGEKAKQSLRYRIFFRPRVGTTSCVVLMPTVAGWTVGSPEVHPFGRAAAWCKRVPRLSLCVPPRDGFALSRMKGATSDELP